MDETIKGLRESLALLLTQAPCIGCEGESCATCRARAALRAYELAEPQRFRDWLSLRAQLDTAEEMAACLSLYESKLSRLGPLSGNLPPLVEMSDVLKWLIEDGGETAREIVQAYGHAKRLASVETR